MCSVILPYSSYDLKGFCNVIEYLYGIKSYFFNTIKDWFMLGLVCDGGITSSKSSNRMKWVNKRNGHIQYLIRENDNQTRDY